MTPDSLFALHRYKKTELHVARQRSLMLPVRTDEYAKARLKVAELQAEVDRIWNLYIESIQLKRPIIGGVSPETAE